MGRTEKIILFLILLITLATRLYYVYTSPPLTLTHDEVGYHRMTLQLLDERIMGYYSHTPRAFVTPGYPLFLALAYFTGRLLHIEPIVAGRTFQVIISVFSVLFVYLIARKAGGPRAGVLGAVLAAVLAAVYQPSFMANNRILTEVLYAFLLLVYSYSIIIAFERNGLRWHALSGALLGLAVLARPTVAPFLIVPYGVRFVLTQDRQVLRGLVVAAAAFCLVMSPWWIRNYLVFDKFIMFSTESGNPFLRGTDPYDIYDRKGPSIIKNVPDAEMTKVALNRIREGLRTDPWLWIKWFTVGKLSFLWLKPWGIYSFWARLLHLWVFVILGWMGILAGLFHEKLRWPALLVVFSTLIHLAFIPIERYMYPLTPIMAIMAATLTVKIIQKILDTASLNR